MNALEFKNQLGDVATDFYIAAGYAVLNNFLDYKAALTIDNLNEHFFRVIGHLAFKGDKFTAVVPEERVVFQKLAHLKILEENDETQEFSFIKFIPHQQLIPIGKPLEILVTKLVEWCDEFDHPDKILTQWPRIRIFLKTAAVHLELLGTMASYWIPEIFEKYEALDFYERTILLGSIALNYETMRQQAIEDNLPWDKKIKEFLDEGLIEPTVSPVAKNKYILKPYRDLKLMAWPDFNRFTHPVKNSVDDLDEKFKELKK